MFMFIVFARFIVIGMIVFMVSVIVVIIVRSLINVMCMCSI